MDETKEASNCFSIGKYAAIASIPILRSFPISVTAPVEAWSEATPYFQEPVMFGPNITGEIDEGIWGSKTGCFYDLEAKTSFYEPHPTAYSVGFSASNSNSIYSGLTVQPASIRFIACIKT